MIYDKFEYDLGSATLTPRQVTKLEHDDRFDSGEYMVCTDKTATEACKGQILSNLWAFNPEFLAEATGLDSKVFTKLATLCEDANAAVGALITSTCGINDFVRRAIEADGRGAFLASFDSSEHEFHLNKSLTLYLYRCN